MLASMRAVLRRFFNLAHRPKSEAALDEEYGSQLKTEIQENLMQDMSAEEPRWRALIAFGREAQAREEYRETRRIRWLGELLLDLRHGARSLRNTPAFAVTIVLTVAIGIGATTSTFSVVDGILYRPLPYKQPDRLVRLMTWDPKTQLRSTIMSKEAYAQFQHSKTLESVAACSLRRWPTFLTFSGGDSPEMLRGEWISAEFLPLLGIQPFLGRGFTQDDIDTARPLAILLYDAWQSSFGADKSIIGRTITFEEGARAIIGVMPPEFRFPAETPGEASKILLPMPAQWTQPYCTLIGRLKPGILPSKAQAEAEVLTSRIFKDRTDTVILVSPLGRIEWLNPTTLLMLAGAVFFLVLIACINVANLLAARNSTRQREFAIRAAIGAGRGRLVRQLMTESLLLSALGGVLGVLTAYLTKDLLLAQLPEYFRPMAMDIAMDQRVLLFSAVLTLTVGLIFGLAPAFQASSPDLSAGLKPAASRKFSLAGRWKIKGGLLAAEVALALVLMSGSGLLINSFVRLHNVDLGFDPTNVWDVSVRFTRAANKERVKRFYSEALTKLRTLPGVQSAAVTGTLPFSNSIINNHPVECGVSAGYFEMLSIPCLRGRLFTTQDELNDAQIAVVNESYANNYFPGENAIGQMIKIEDEKKTLQVVGIVRNTRSELRFPAGPVIYVPYNSAYKGNGFLIKMMPGNKDPASWLKSQLASVNRGFPVSASKLEQRLGRSISDEAFYTLILGIFAAIGMILTMVGIAGLSMQNVARRRHEIGVRLALGAEPPQVVALVIRQIVIPVVLGLAIGIAAASALTRMLANLLFDIKPRDPATFFIVSVLMLSVSLVAGYLPARRASRIDPLETLRCD